MKRILTVDDSASTRYLVAATLECEGYEVVQAASGKEAIEKLDGCDIHLILSDLNMPNMDGLELTRQVRAMSNYKFVPIVLLTTVSDPAKKQEGKMSGATGWLMKPFDPVQLVAVVKKVMR